MTRKRGRKSAAQSDLESDVATRAFINRVARKSAPLKGKRLARLDDKWRSFRYQAGRVMWKLGSQLRIDAGDGSNGGSEKFFRKLLKEAGHTCMRHPCTARATRLYFIGIPRQGPPRPPEEMEWLALCSKHAGRGWDRKCPLYDPPVWVDIEHEVV